MKLTSDKEIDQYFSDQNYMALLPLLEQRVSDFDHIANEKLLTLVEYALEWKMKDYWQSLAIQWIEDGLPIRENTIRKLESIPADKGYSQNLRHRVIKILKKRKVNISLQATRFPRA